MLVNFGSAIYKRIQDSDFSPISCLQFLSPGAANIASRGLFWKYIMYKKANISGYSFPFFKHKW